MNVIDMYRPLPDSLTVGDSNIDGIGLFAKEDIPSDTVFGISHVRDDRFPDGYIRTPLGGFFNHSDTPNCSAYIVDSYIYLKSILLFLIKNDHLSKSFSDELIPFNKTALILMLSNPRFCKFFIPCKISGNLS